MSARDFTHRRIRSRRSVLAVTGVIAAVGRQSRRRTAACPASYSDNEADYQYINNVDSGYWQNDAPALANWGGSGSTNSLIWVTSSPGSTSKPGSLSLKIYHLALGTNHVQDFTSCTNQAPSI